MDLKLENDNNFLKVVKYENSNEYDQLRVCLTRKVKDYRFIPAVKEGLWNGDITFIDDYNRIPSGLWHHIHTSMIKYNYKVNFFGVKTLFDNTINYEEFFEFCTKLMESNKIKPRDYQIKASFNILKYRRCGNLLATSSGKTLMTYLCLAYGLHKKLIKNVLMIVPSVGLVTQAANDFISYNTNDFLKLKIQQVYSNSEKVNNSNITIGTYQSLVKCKLDYFKKFDAVIIDEFHKSKTKSIINIMGKLKHCVYKIGMTGTLPPSDSADLLTVISLTGPIINDIRTNILIDEGFVTPVKIKILKLDYAPIEVKEAISKLHGKIESTALFQKEKEYIIKDEKRFKFITNLISQFKTNSLVLFHQIEYGEKIYEELKRIKKSNVYHIDGSTKNEDRTLYKKIMDNDKKITYITFEFLGFNIKVLDNTNILLSNGSYKKAKNIVVGDDIDDNFLSKYITKK